MINYAKHSIDESDIYEVTKVLRDGKLTQGDKIEEFEQAICNYTGAKYCVVMSSGTAALISAGTVADENLTEFYTSPNTFVATANSMLHNRIRLNFIDIDPETYNMQLTRNEFYGAIILPVHFAGNPIDMRQYKTLKGKNLIIEDACHALGAKYEDGSTVGNCKYSDMTVFSFHPAKTITTGEGGAITTNDVYYYSRLKSLRDHGRKDGDMIELGQNFRITDIQAALGISQLKRIDNLVKKRKFKHDYYTTELIAYRDYIQLPIYNDNSSFNLYVVQVFNRDEVKRKMEKAGINCQIHYKPVYDHTYIKTDMYYHDFKSKLPVMESYKLHCLTLPLYPDLTREEQDYIIKNLIEAVQ